MSADLHIHAMSEDMTESDLRCFFRHSMGSKYFSWFGTNTCISGVGSSYDCEHRKRVTDSDAVWIGAVSWLKAALTDDDSFVPEPVEAVGRLIGENMPVLDDSLRDKLLTALALDRNVRAPHYETVQNHGGENVVRWLDEHVGQRLFTVSW